MFAQDETAPGLVEIDFAALTAVCAEQGKWVEQVLSQSGILSPRTLDRIRKGLGIRRATLEELLPLIGPQNLARILRHPAMPTGKVANGGQQVNGGQLVEWTDAQFLQPWVTLPNGLQYLVSKMRHRHLADTFARVKCYELRFVAADARPRLQEQLTRHAAVCRKLTPDPRIPINQGAFPDPSWDCWWVIDYWIDGITLSDALSSERMPFRETLRTGRELAEGLKLLHDHGIVRRELNPDHVLLRASDRSVVLTDFELAKLLGGAPTVARDWPKNPYRAPELAEGAAATSVDIYSWGRIMSYMALGVLPSTGREKKSLQETDLPEPLINLICQCVGVSPRSRPSDMQSVIDSLATLK